MKLYQIVREEFASRTAGMSADCLAKRIVDRIFAESRDALVALISNEIGMGPAAYSSAFSEYDEDAILDVSDEDVATCIRQFFGESEE